MKKTIYLIVTALVLLQVQAFAQRKCGAGQIMASMIARDSSWVQRFAAQKASLQGIADNYKLQLKLRGAERTTSTISPVPVIFHIIVNPTQLAQMGGTAGVQERVDSQIAVLNRDYNRQNADSTLIPTGWKSLYASVGIHFGLAHTDPSGNVTPGYEILISDYSFTQGAYGDYSDAKNSTYGLAAWDNTKYMNVWCIYFSDQPSLLGITCPKSWTEGTSAEPANDEGICINYLALGCQNSAATLNFPTSGDYQEGRTLTHEVGHFFEIWHTWGDDEGLCPWNTPYPGCPNNGDPPTSGIGYDDGLGDTPPEGDHEYGDPPYTLPGGTFNDCCQYMPGSTVNQQPYGVCSQCFINYTDDNAMHMFTKDQAAAMASMVLVPPGTGTGATGSGTIGESYSLTQNPGLVEAVPTVVGMNNSFNVYPNPTNGIVNISFDATMDQLRQVTVTNVVGQVVKHMDVAAPSNYYYSIDLSAMDKGIYFIKCNFASGSITRKILLQ